MIKKPTFCLVERHTWPHPTKSGSLRYYFPLMKKTPIDSFQRLPVKESFNLFGRETNLATTNLKWQSEMLPFLDDHLYA